MSTPKDRVRRILEKIPDDASYEDIQYHIYVCQKIRKGLGDLEGGRVVSHTEAKRRMSRWLSK